LRLSAFFDTSFNEVRLQISSRVKEGLSRYASSETPNMSPIVPRRATSLAMSLQVDRRDADGQRMCAYQAEVPGKKMLTARLEQLL